VQGQQGHPGYSSLAHGLSWSVTPAHSPDQVAQSNTSTYPHSTSKPPLVPQPPVVPHWHVRQDVVDVRWILSTFYHMIYANLLIPTQTSPVRDASTDPIAPQLVSRCVLSQNPVAQIEAPNACPNCKRNFNRRQELKRHLRSNLPHWIHCPTSQCGWTGNRLYSLKKHMTAHPQGGLAPRPGEYQIYNPEELVESMARGTLSFGSAAAIALSMVDARVDERFAQPYKVGVISNAWNRGRRKFCKARN
jgi:uncharacterized CHY-type Zn-finger protein